MAASDVAAGSALLQDGRHPEALRVLRHAVKLQPRAAELYVRLGSALVAGRSLSAMPLADRQAIATIARVAVSLQPSSSSLWCNFGLALAATGRPHEHAARAYARALERDPTHTEAYLGLASVQPRSEAVATLRLALLRGRGGGGTGHVYYNLGNLLQNGRFELAGSERAGALGGACGAVAGAEESAGTELIDGSPYGGAVAQLAREAVGCFHAAARLQPSNPEAHYNRGECSGKHT